MKKEPRREVGKAGDRGHHQLELGKWSRAVGGQRLFSRICRLGRRGLQG